MILEKVKKDRRVRDQRTMFTLWPSAALLVTDMKRGFVFPIILVFSHLLGLHNQNVMHFSVTLWLCFRGNERKNTRVSWVKEQLREE